MRRADVPPEETAGGVWSAPGFRLWSRWPPHGEPVADRRGASIRARAHLPAGGLAVLPAGATHWVYADEDTILQVNGMGPFDIKYVNPKDDPQRKSQ